jgi:hypothetical protein
MEAIILLEIREISTNSGPVRVPADGNLIEGGGVMGWKTTTEETRVGEKQKEFLCPRSWSVHNNLAHNGYNQSTCCFLQAKF